MMTLDPLWASPLPGDSGHPLGFIESPLGPHVNRVTWPAGWPHMDLVRGVVTWASHMPGDTGPHVGLTWTW